MRKPKVVLLAQTPPPHGGQSVMLELLVKAKWDWCLKRHIKLDYSEKENELSRFSPVKILKLFRIICKVWIIRLEGKIDVLFYPPSGPHKIPFYRDVMTLVLTRWCAKKIIFQFHAGGFDLLYGKLNRIEKWFARVAYQHPNAGIVLLESLRKEIGWIFPLKTYTVPNGIGDQNKVQEKRTNAVVEILLVAILSESKGVLTSLEAVNILKKRNIKCRLNLIGNWKDEAIKSRTFQFIHRNELSDYCVHHGVQVGAAKWDLFGKSDIFCLPSFEMEGMPVTIVEAMMMALPVVTTRWRTIPDIVDDNVNGYLVPIKDPGALADKLEILINDAELRRNMGKRGRAKYLAKYTREKHLELIESVFKEIVND